MKTLHRFLFTGFVVCLSLSVSGKDNITILRSEYLVKNPACPKTEYYDGYSVEAKSTYKAYEWKITGGSFKDKFGQLKDKIIVYQNEIVSGRSYVTVIWNNVKSKDGKEAPKGTVTIDTYNSQTLIAGNINGSGKIEQEIKSLNDLIPPSLSSDPSLTQIIFGQRDVRVFLSGPFNFPGVKVNGFVVPVNQYEWQIPSGWTAKTGSKTSSGTYITSSAEIKLVTDASSGGEVKVRGINDCAGSGDYSVYSWPIVFTRKSGIEFSEYPQTVPFGENGTYKFSVMPLSGVSFEWEAPAGWSINGGGNTYSGSNIVQITTSACPTSQKVRVSMVQGGVISPATEFPTTVAFPAINIPAGEIKQYLPATFSLNMPDDKIASVEWLVNNKSAGIVTNKSSCSFVIYESGKVKISTKITLKGCSPVTTPEKEINVIKAPDPYISGPSAICDQATYTIENLPPGATVQWSNGSNLSIPSGLVAASCTAKVTGNGFSWIKASINGMPVIEKVNIQVGCPSPSYISTKIGLNNTLYPNNPNLCDAEARWTGSYDFNIIEYGWQSVGWDIVVHPMIMSPIGSHMSAVRFNPISPSNPTYVKVRARNSCGWGEWSDPRSVNISYSSTASFYLYPNPASDIVTLSLQEQQQENTSLSMQRTTKTFSTSTYEIQLWSTSSMVRRFTTDQPMYQISVSGLPSGIYIVRVIKDGKTYTNKLIKK